MLGRDAYFLAQSRRDERTGFASAVPTGLKTILYIHFPALKCWAIICRLCRDSEHEPRIKACAAFAPVTDVEDRIGNAAASLDSAIPGYRDFLRFSSPRTHVDKLMCPVFLFYAKDDTNVAVRQSTAFAAALKKTNSTVTLVSVARGGQYDSMLHEGIPKAIQWFQKLP